MACPRCLSARLGVWDWRGRLLLLDQLFENVQHFTTTPFQTKSNVRLYKERLIQRKPQFARLAQLPPPKTAVKTDPTNIAPGLPQLIETDHDDPFRVGSRKSVRPYRSPAQAGGDFARVWRRRPEPAGSRKKKVVGCKKLGLSGYNSIKL